MPTVKMQIRPRVASRCAVEDLKGVGLPDSGLPVRQEDHEGHATVLDVVVGHIVVEQLDVPLQAR